MFAQPSRYAQGSSSSVGTNELTNGFSSATASMSGNTAVFEYVATGGNAIGNLFAFGTDFRDFWAIYKCAMVGGADTVLTSVTADGNPGRVIVQANAGGTIAAIILVPFRPDARPSGFIVLANATFRNHRIVLNTIGTAPTAASITGHHFLLRYPEPNWSDANATAIDTVRTLTVPSVLQGDRVVLISCNNVQAAQACNWTGTGSPGEDNQEGNVGSGLRRSLASASNLGTSLTYIATWDVISTTGVAIAGASFKLKS